MPRYFNLMTLLLSVTPFAAVAGDTDSPAVPVTDLGVIGATPSNWRLGMALGYGVRSNPLIQSEDIPVIVDLDIAWFGEHFFFDNGDLGLTVTDNEWLTLSAVTRFNSDRVFFGKTNTRFVQVGSGTSTSTEVEVTVPDRDYAIEFGAELITDGNWGRLQLGAFTDISGTHGGYELDASYSVGWRRQRWHLGPAVSVSYKSAELNAYYWGVRESESNAALPAYEPGAGINVALRLLGSYQLTPNWVATVVAEYERLNDEAAASPIVQDDHVGAFFAGFAYRF